MSPLACRVSYGCHGVVQGAAKASEGKAMVNVSFDGAEGLVGTDCDLLSMEVPTTKLATGFQVGDEVFYLGKSMKWPSGDKVSVGAKGVTRGPGESGPNEISVLFEGNTQAISLDPGHNPNLGKIATL